MRFSIERWEKVKASVNKPYGLDFMLYFGKYKNCTFRTILGVDHKYVRFLIDKCNKEFNAEVIELLERYEDYDHIL